MNLTAQIAKKMINGDYAFVYLSPEVLLNNKIFHEVFCNTKFRNRLVLTVVDEAHMVYVWGLVASGAAKKIKSHLQQ
ncbi:hypothetical protein PCASD_18428 [Puccinia coronata f. sp. avenae]|uniref:Helicase ATP-binding domain-containing protein n=1 Tax=Puccinia coronata f. sp. avenae TaxID=200324 RepID=A0A2N5TZ36_9BASI|nr:hypothetical protein PCASD_18428 [Puccinia coronata f. sp. avenae]